MLLLKYLKHMVRSAGGRFRRLAHDSRGFALFESVIAVTIFAALGTAVMVGIRTANISTQVVERHSIAEKLARNQMEYVFTQGYLNPGPGVNYISIENDSDFTVDSGFSVSATAQVVPTNEIPLVTDADIEKVVVTV